METVIKKIIESLGTPDKANEYEITPDEDGRWWINHKQIGSGELLEDWLKEHLIPKQETMFVPVICLGCGHTFNIESNGRRYTHTEENNYITNSDEVVCCPNCTGNKLKFK